VRSLDPVRSPVIGTSGPGRRAVARRATTGWHPLLDRWSLHPIAARLVDEPRLEVLSA
jgi:hypothetical protein